MKHVTINGRPYRAYNFRIKDGREWADVDGYYGDIVQWRQVGCVKRIAQVLSMEDETMPIIAEKEGQLTLF